MNKQRIAELREKSMPAVENNNGLGLWNNGLVNDWYEQWFENFAELIVQECVKIADEEDFDVMMKEGYPCSQTAKKIKQHFGVE